MAAPSLGTFLYQDENGTKWYSQAIVHGNITAAVHVGFIDFTATDSGPSDSDGDAIFGQSITFSSSTDFTIGKDFGVTAVVSDEGDQSYSLNYGPFGAGVIKYADGTYGTLVAAGVGGPFLNANISLDYNSPFSDFVSANDTVQLMPDGTYIVHTYIDDQNMGEMIVHNVTYDRNGNVISDQSGPVSMAGQAALASGLPLTIDHCFARGTKIQTPLKGEVNIEDVHVGDIVSSFRAGSKDLSIGRVVRLFNSVTETWIRLSNGLVVTPGHYFSVPGGGFKSIESILAAGGHAVDISGSAVCLTGEYVRF
ncbi:MAG TPA: hypothetical protein VHW43_04125 [Puia sp.]|nr:hypothetical protein [Puia sp.]